MKRMVGVLLAAVLLAGCGADGEPEPPQVATTVTITNQGVSANAAVTVRQGPVTLGLSL